MAETTTDTVEVSEKEEPPPAKRRSGRLKMALLGGGIFITVVLLTVAAIFFRDTRIVDRHFEDGNVSYDKAFNELEAALQDLSKVKISDDDLSALEEESDRILKRIPKAHRHLDRARGHFDLMRKSAFAGWEARAASLSHRSVLQAEKGTDELTLKIRQIGTTAEILVTIREASKKFNDGFSKVNQAINDGNADKFDEAQKSATDAEKLFTQSKTLLARANEQVLDADMSDAMVKVGRARLWAQGTQKMIKAGLDENMEQYNLHAQKNNDLSEEVTNLARDPILSNPDKWMRDGLEDQNERVQTSFSRADKYREQALRLWEKNT